MRGLWHIFLIVTMGASIATAGTVSCRDWKPGATECNPYSGTFLKIKKIKKRIASLRNRPITTREIPIAQRIKVKNGITLDSLIRKYIKREERLYRKTELKKSKKRQGQKVKSTQKKKEQKRAKKKKKEKEKEKEISKNVEIEKPKKKLVATNKKIVLKQQVKKEKIPSISRVIEQSSHKEPRKLLIEKTSPKKPNKTKIIELPKAVILTPVEKPKADLNTSSEEQEPRTEKALGEEAILPAELVPDRNTTYTEIKPSIEREFAVYVVQKGDSLAGIARKFGIDIVNLAEINQLNRKNTLKIGQKLRIPLSQRDTDAIATASYVVKRGDTLSSIAKHFHVKLHDIVKYNRIKKRSIIHIGQKLVLPLPHKLVELKRIEAKKKKERLRKKKERERLARIALKKRQKARFLREAKGLKRRLSVTATAYTSHRGQTDKTPFLAAWNNRIRPGMKIIAVSRDLIYKYGITNGSRVRISGLKDIYTVRDKMNKKWRKKIDIYMGTSRWRALRWGKRRVTLYY